MDANLPDLDQLDREGLLTLLVAEHQQLLETQQRLASRDSEVAHLKLLIAKLQRQQFGRRSEKVQRQIDQLELRLEELEANKAAESTRAVPAEVAPTFGSKPRRGPLPEHLPREVHRREPKETVCPGCGRELRKIGEDVSEMLEHVPEHFKVIRQVRPKLSCAACERIKWTPLLEWRHSTAVNRRSVSGHLSCHPNVVTPDAYAYSHLLLNELLYFHAQYRQATPARGLNNQWKDDDDPLADAQKNIEGKDNYVWMEARGRGHYVGVTTSVLQNQDDWWGEGDDMFFVDGAATPTINGTGSEDYFSGAFGFGNTAFSYDLFGAPVKGGEIAGSRSSLYRFHLDSPIPFSKSFRATIEHGHANVRSDNYFSVAYWYQTEPHMPFPPLPSLHERLPRLYPVGGPGNAETLSK